MSAPDFEVHIGMSKPMESTDVVAIPAVWKREPVFDLMHLKRRQFEQHNVEGRLLTLLTRHARDINEVQALVQDAAEHCCHEPSSRIEVEQVLVSCDRQLEIGDPSEFPFNPTVGAFPRMALIPQTPPYEVHYCLSWATPRDKPTMDQIAAIARSAKIGIDELVEFGGDAKITTTKFYRSLSRMASELTSDAKKFLAALDESGLNLRFRLIAERIITCGIPLKTVEGAIS